MRAHKSDSQANAEALARRTATYADEHAASWQVRFDRPTHEPKSLRGYVNELRDAYEAECPSRLHRHDVDGGGTPAFTVAFEAWLDGTDRGPFRDCIRGMARSGDERTRRRASIVGRLIIGGISAVDAATQDGVPSWCAEIVAYDAVRVAWRRYCSTPIARSSALAKAEAIA